MPKLFEYRGLILRFFSDEHEPIHIHAFYKECQTKVEFNIEDGIISSICYKKIQGYEVIPEEKMKDEIDTGFLSWNNGEMEISAHSVFHQYSKNIVEAL